MSVRKTEQTFVKRRLTIMKHFIIRNSFSFALVALILLFSMLFITKLSIVNSDSDYIEVTVEQGDTLWHLAEKYNSEKKDITSFISQVKKINELNESNIKVGDVILIPVTDIETHFTMKE